MQKLRVWHIPQVPGKPFYVAVDSVQSAVLVMDTLANYDLFQLENKIKGDYANVTGLELWDEASQEWFEWCWESDDGEFFFECPREYLEWLNPGLNLTL